VGDLVEPAVRAEGFSRRYRKERYGTPTERHEAVLVNVTGIDHFVFTVADVSRTCAFYETLGGEVVTFGDGRKAVQFGDQKINVHPEDNEFKPVAAAPTSGAGDFCLVTETPLEEVQAELREHDIEVVMGPVERTGAAGPITSVYVRDPDDNLVEIARYEE